MQAQRTTFVALLREANLTDADLRGSNLQGAVLNGAKLIRTNLFGIVVPPLKDAQGQVRVLQMVGVDMSLASLRKSQLMGDFRKSNLSMVDLRDAVLTGDFREADLSNALMLNTNLSGSNFTGGKLTGAYLEGCKLNKCVMPNGKAAGWDNEKFRTAMNPSGRGEPQAESTPNIGLRLMKRCVELPSICSW
jgi:uncharacterized protein YjbI with pentapeptide repeats